MKRKNLISVLSFLLAAFPACAQFYTGGDEQGNLKWYSFRTQSFRIIYPEGLDSLAKVYGTKLEEHKSDVGRSIGVEPNANYRRPMPVVLRGFTADANGMVAWTPRRMELQTCAEVSAPGSLDWEDELTIHESRHVAQMQLGHGKGYRFTDWMLGQLLPGAMAAIYMGPAFLEGDAVTAETALSRSGRGRSADFLEYYMAAFDSGDTRDWYRWRYGSQKLYTPDYYKVGYLTVAGIRYLYDEPGFTKEYLDRVNSRVVFKPLFNLQKTLRTVSGKNLKATWREIASVQDSIWKENREARGPFNEAERITSPERRFTEYIGTTMLNGDMYAIRKGISTPTSLVRISKDGTVEALRFFARGTSPLMASEPLGRIYWSESIPDIRWTLKDNSCIFYLDIASGRSIRLTSEGRLYNPAPSPDGNSLSAVELPYEGGSAVVVLDSRSGERLRSFRAPDGLQVIEAAWVDGAILCSALSDQGIGFYDATRGFNTVLAPSFANIKQLRSDGNRLLFVCDRDGVNELYALQDSKVSKLSSNRNGASEFVVDGSDVYSSVLSTEGRDIWRSAENAVEVDFYDQYLYPIAEKLSEQERLLKESSESPEQKAEFSEVRRYRKVPHLFQVHSWAPLYIGTDAIDKLSLDELYSSGGIGATVFFQNSLGSMDGSLGYSLSEGEKGWTNSLHGKFTYSGRYPTVEASFDVGDRNSRQYNVTRTKLTATEYSSLGYGEFKCPSVRGTVKAYIPFNFTRGGWNRGFIPQVGVTLTNDWLNSTVIKRTTAEITGKKDGLVAFFDGTEAGKNLPLTRLYASVRGYSILSRTSSGIYPRWGIGAESGGSVRAGLGGIFTPSVYAYVYGYAPGIMDTHGMKFTLTAQKQFGATFPEPYVSIYPRGIAATSEIQKYVAARYASQAKASIDYAMPLLPLDCSILGPVAYLRNLEFTAHFDSALYGSPLKESFGTMFMYSAGASLSVRTGNFLWLPYDSRIGISYSFNGSNKAESMKTNGAAIEQHHIGFVFEMDL